MKIFYDGDCYFCTNFVRLLSLRHAVGEVQLMSLREDNEDVRRILSSGLNVNTGFVVEHDGKVLYGSHAFHYLTTLAEPRNFLSRMLFLIGEHPQAARLLYPVMVFGRYLVLIAQGGTLIEYERQPWQESTQEGLGPRLVRMSALLLTVLGLTRLGVFGSYPMKALQLLPVLLLTVTAVAAWTRFFYKAAYARQIYNRIRQADWSIVIAYVAILLLIVNTLDIVLFRRLAAFITILPLLAVAVDLYRKYGADPQIGKIPAIVPFAILVFAFFPGLYMAPFYGGIFGWTAHVDRSRPIVVSGYKLVNQDGDEIWYNHAFFQPVTMNGRFRRAFSDAIPETEKFVQFMFDNYKRIYPMLETGRMPHEWALGRFAYPSHNLSDNNSLDYVGKFEPSKIIGMETVVETYNFDGTFLEAKKGVLIPVNGN
ncbi:DCC1-like thiol-disulfide oxidoreductase family protein [Rhizobium sp. SL42]|uniref:DCC1-like thiol-disulfide oxidoreductase family protein n=1 Tax=Rhizobium sp. SL42 TaxID=2806346 RepID=UPI001F3076F9|nr:DCC1-like thiol-disulfide oxidoreductase family protein [Rhizobium sp. SL42]UJW76418.1 DUF393 domain-containing protein [Rhizobium sp. SL42]